MTPGRPTLVVPLAAALVAALTAALAPGAEPARPRRPNILLILADDLGYGDLGCCNDQAKAPTPHLDRLAGQGMRFTDAHSPATVCTPTRYSLLTGRMCFRTGYRGVFTGAGGPCLIEPGRLTLPGMLRKAGYATAMTGKWHVGLTFLDKQGKGICQDGLEAVKRIDFSRAIPDAPVHRGFDRFFGTACCPTTDWLYAFIDGDRIPQPPTAPLDRSKLPHHPYANDCRPGLAAPNFKHEEIDLIFLEQSRRFLREHVKAHPDQPFFLFHSMQAVHLPSFPADAFKGKTQAGPHGDFIHEMDWVVGRLLAELDELGVADNTLVIFASDNGPEVASVVHMRKDHAHDGARPWRGMKRDQWEGGHRTPLLVRWPGRVRPGAACDQLISLTDIFATCAAVVGADLPNDAAEDSFDMLGVLLGRQGDQGVRPYLLQQTLSAALSIRRGQWKYLDHQGSGGNNYLRSPALKPYHIGDEDPSAPAQLYNLADDPGERHNLYSKQPKIAAELKALLEKSKKSGRSAQPRPARRPSKNE